MGTGYLLKSATSDGDTSDGDRLSIEIRKVMGTGYLLKSAGQVMGTWGRWGQVIYCSDGDRGRWGQVIYCSDGDRLSIEIRRSSNGDDGDMGTMGTGYLLRVAIQSPFPWGRWGQGTMGTGYLLRVAIQSPFPHSSVPLLRVSYTSVNSFDRPQCLWNESFRSHSTCQDALSPCASTHFHGRADMAGTLAKAQHTLTHRASLGEFGPPRRLSHHVIPQIA